MIKNIENATSKEIQNILRKSFDIYEMLDMFMFGISFDDNGRAVLRSDMKTVIYEFECVVDSVYEDMLRFSENGCFDSIYEMFGKCKIMFAYLPVKKSKNITYRNMEEGSFIFVDFYCDDKSRKDYDKIMSMIGSVCLSEPIVANGCYLPENFADYGEKERRESILSMFDETYSGLEKDEIEGVILNFGSKRFKVSVRSTECESDDIFGRHIYRDAVLNDFSKTVLTDFGFVDRLYSSSDNYIGFVGALFTEYMNMTDIFRKYEIDDIDLTSPNMGYVGEMDYERIPGTASVLCRYDRKARNILKILLYTLCPISKLSSLSSLSSVNMKNILKLKNMCEKWF